MDLPPSEAAPRLPQAAVERIVAGSVLPCLAQGLSSPAPPPGWAGFAAALAARLPGMPLPEAVAILRALSPGGRRFELVCRDILLPAAERLRAGHDPEAPDQSGYLLGLWRLRMLLIGLDDPADWSAEPPPAAGAALTLDPHTLAPSVEHAVSARFLSREGWSVHDCCCGAEEGCDTVHDDPYDVAWLTLDAETDLEVARSLAERLRRASRNPRIRLLGGGGADLPEVPAGALGLDGLTRDATAAPRLARRLLS